TTSTMTITARSPTARYAHTHSSRARTSWHRGRIGRSTSGSQAVTRSQMVRDASKAGVRAIACRHQGVGNTPVCLQGRVVPGDAQFVGRVVIRVDEVREGEVGDCGKAVPDTGRDEHPAIIVLADLEDL